MGGILDKIFIDPSTLEGQPGGVVKILFLMVVYAFVLFKASNLISDGSELLLLIPSVAGIVGSVVLPILGAVPDGMIVLFSGLGPREEAQEQLSVGVGALAGSTIMLLTIPWFCTLLAGRVSLDEHGVGAYRRKDKLVAPRWSLLRTGINVKPGLRVSALIMIVTALSYLLIQGPAFSYARRAANDDNGTSASSTSSNSSNENGNDDSSEVRREHWWALAGLLVSVAMFVGYLVYQVVTANRESNKDRIAQAQHDAVCRSLVSVSAVFAEQLFADDVKPSERSALLQRKETNARFDALMREFFNRHDVDGNGVVDTTEMRGLLAALGEHPSKEEFAHLMEQMDTNHDGVIQYDEFYASMKAYIKHLFDKDNGLAVPITVVVPDDTPAVLPPASETASTTSTTTARVGAKPINDDDVKKEDGEEEEEEEEEEQEEVPDDLTHLPPKKQRLRIVLRSCWMMGLGVVLVILFSDPMVDVFSSLGHELGIDSFYIAFTLAPLASNASELIAAINYARKKTVRTATIGCESLIGAACMNNTFCLAIFLLLIFARGLAWRFSAETLAILVVELAMLGFAVQRTQRLLYGFIILLLYPLSIGFVVFLEKVVHWN